FFSSRRRHTSFSRDWSSDVCSSDLPLPANTQSAHQQSNSKTSIEDFLQPPPPTKRKGKGHARDLSTASHVSTSRLLGASNGRTRSEERRVGKEERPQRAGQAQEKHR